MQATAVCRLRPTDRTNKPGVRYSLSPALLPDRRSSGGANPPQHDLSLPFPHNTTFTRLAVHATSSDSNTEAALPLLRMFDTVKRALDFSKGRRMSVLKEFYGDLSTETAERLLAPDFVMQELGSERRFGRKDYMNLLYGIVMPAVPDFSWGWASSGDVDDEGYCIVTVQATGHHMGAPFVMPGMPPLPSSGRHFCLAPEVQKVKVVDGKIKEVLVLPSKGAGPRALYVALGGQLPPVASTPPAAGSAPPMP